MSNVFDGLPDIFAETFGEAVEYTPLDTGVAKVIRAIWWQTSLTVGFEGAGVDASKTELSVRAADVASPREGDIAKRLSDGKIMTLSTPILPDGKGMIVCNLAAA